MYYSDELYHHGRLKQRWGFRNGPPYPLSRATVKKVYGSRKEQRRVEKERREAAKRPPLQEDEKKRLLVEGTASEIFQYINELTYDEINNAVNRIKKVNELESLASREMERGWKSIDSTMRKVGDAGNWINTIINIYKTFRDLDKPQNGGGGGKKKKKK